jgi:putative Holliday junction resolvase
MRTLAIDPGTKRIGLALSDEAGQLATPYDVLHVKSPEQAIDPIIKLIQDEGVKRVIVGLPLNMDGSVGPQARDTIAWADLLRKQVTVPILFVDERLSSFDAEQQLIERKRGGERITRKSKKQQLDALVAAAILQAFLNGSVKPTPIPEPG